MKTADGSKFKRPWGPEIDLSMLNVIPSGKLTLLIMENHNLYGKAYYKWQFSIAMLNYQRV